ncbi:MAG: Rhodanese domain protein [Bryobacterales bacterium]|nr:Rhodanese domain protein [Bryobacterales bacterium]
MSQYADPQVLVSTEWAEEHLNDPTVRLVEVDVENDAYDQGHIPGAIAWSWQRELSDQVLRDVIPRDKFEQLLSQTGIARDTTVVLYGDNNNWFAAWAFWQLKIYGHPDVRLLNGGRKKWLLEGRELTHDVPVFAFTEYRAQEPDYSLRAFLPDVQKAVRDKYAALVDVRSPQEFTGEILAPPGLPETAQRGGHIPGARSIPWGKAANEDGSFKSFEELKELYANEGIEGNKPIITYCRIGERSSYSWFVLKYLLGYRNVTNYDGSWTEWGNLVAAPIERGIASPLREAVAHAG